MKKVLLLAVTAGLVSFTSCKKEANDAANSIENAANETGDAIEAGANDVADATENAYEDAKALVTDAPEISNNELQDWVNKLHDEAVKAKASAETGNQEELNEAVATITSLSESLSNFKDDPEYGEAEAYYNEVKAELETL